jgi:lipopolysaccharide transport system permease protein
MEGREMTAGEMPLAACSVAPPPRPTGSNGQPPQPLRTIEPAGRWTSINWSELWQFRDLLYFLTWRDVKVRYKQTVLGAAWAILQPTLQMVVFTLIFGRLAGMEKQTEAIGVAYPLFAYGGLLLWMFFQNAVSNSAASMVGSANLITKVYFPRLAVPFAAVAAALVDLAVSFPLLVPMMFLFKEPLSAQVVVMPLAVLGAFFTAAGVGTLLAALTVAYRDFRYVVPFLLQLWMAVSFVYIPSQLVSEKWRFLLYLNPMAGFIDAFRASLFGLELNWLGLGLALASSVVLFLIGATYFRNVERRFADII